MVNFGFGKENEFGIDLTHIQYRSYIHCILLYRPASLAVSVSVRPVHSLSHRHVCSSYSSS